MEASKPAPDLSFATLAVPDPARARAAGDPLAQGPAGLGAKSYHSTLDAADYAPKAVSGEPPDGQYALAAGRRELLVPPGAAIAWSTASAGPPQGGTAAGEPEPGAARIMAVRARLRRMRLAPPHAAGIGDAPSPDTGRDAPGPAPERRARPGLLLLAGIALLAGGVYLLAHALTAAAPPRTNPARTESGVDPAGAKPDLADPTTPRPAGAGGAAG
jgi:hypothetical protein